MSGRGRTDGPRRRSGRLVVPLVAVVVVIGLLVIMVPPVRSYLDQRKRASVASVRLTAVERENRELEGQVTRLSTPEEIERQARAQYGMIRPGETAYAVLPAPAGPLRLPQLWPYQR